MKKSKVTFNVERLQYSVDVLYALAHPLRLRILEYIDENEVINVNKIYRTLKLEQSITSQHLRVLRNAGIVQSERNGKFINYSIDYSILERTEFAINNFIKAEKPEIYRATA